MSARGFCAALGAAAVVVALLAIACDDPHKKDSNEPLASPSSVAETLGIDASALGLTPTDPPAPAGDLRSEIDRFTTLDACVAEHSRVDPLVGDSLRALGYDTFLRDACRTLEALKEKDRARCKPIDSTALELHCESVVAMTMGTPETCPLAIPDDPANGREPLCVAVSARDPRLCAGATHAKRAECEALLAHDGTKCKPLAPEDRDACAREVARYQSVVPVGNDKLAAFPTPAGKLEIHGTDGTPDPPAPIVDIASDVQRGVVVSMRGEHAELILGSFLGDRTTIAPGPAARARMGVYLDVGSSDATTRVTRAELAVPGEALYSYPGARFETKVTLAKIDKTRGGTVTIALEATVGVAPHVYKVKLDATTFARDVTTATGPAPIDHAPSPAPPGSAPIPHSDLF